MNKNTAAAIQYANAEDEKTQQMHKRKADDLASKLPKKKVKVVRMSCKTCRKAQGLCKYIGQPGHLVQNGYIYHHIYLNRGGNINSRAHFMQQG